MMVDSHIIAGPPMPTRLPMLPARSPPLLAPIVSPPTDLKHGVCLSYSLTPLILLLLLTL